MQKIIKPIRIAILILIPILLSAVCLLALYKLQIVSGAAYYEQSLNNIVTTEKVSASRGSILDRYGRLLVSNRICYNVVINREELTTDADPNGILLRLIDYCSSLGIPYTDTTPISKTAPFTYPEKMTDTQTSRLESYKEHFELDEKISAPDLMKWFRDHYSIPESYTDEQARLAAGVRYELELRSLFGLSEYIFAADVDVDLISRIGEQDLSGVSIRKSSTREYNTEYAAHILGYIGPMDGDEYEKYSKEGYPMDAYVGKDGIEQYFESELHGVDGELTTIKTSTGATTATVYSKEPQPGNNIVLTIDIMLQQVAENALADTITEINEQRAAENLKDGTKREMAEGGAVVVLQVGTGDVLASASYPSYNLATFLDDYSSLEADERLPLLNRALMGTYSPGSTFKPVTAIAALCENIISTGTTIYDASIYTEYEGYQPTCWVYPMSHGTINVTQAIEVSCNYFFYETGHSLGIDRLASYARQFGLGEHTGVELYEYTGTLATREYKEEEVGESWYGGDTLQAAIGQSYNLFTPMQLASYCATFANNGTRYAAHFLKSVKSNDNTTTLEAYTPNILSSVSADKEYYDAIKTGMLNSSRNGTASSEFGYFEIDVCSKTGTAQLGEDMENNAVFIAFAPYEKPEVAIAVVVERGGSGSAVSKIAKRVFEYYFQTTAQGGTGENELIP